MEKFSDENNGKEITVALTYLKVTEDFSLQGIGRVLTSRFVEHARIHSGVLGAFSRRASLVCDILKLF